MGHVTKSGIWTPGEGEALDPEVYLAAMAASIENGLGERMNKQEKRVSCRATAPDPFDVVSTVNDGNAYKAVPLTIGGWTGSRSPDPDFAPGNHAEGITFEASRAKIVTPGFYSIVGQITIYNGAGMANHSWDFFGSVNASVFGLPDYGATNSISFTSGRVSDIRYLSAGDTVGLTVGIGTDHIGAIRVQDAVLTLGLIYAT